MTADLKQAIIEKALALGFDGAGVTSAEAPAAFGHRLSHFLSCDRHGDMAWLGERTQERSSPNALWPDAKSVIMLGMNYGPEQDPMNALQHADRGAVSVYAQRKDYHDILKKRLKQLGRWIVESWSCEVKVFVDTAPVMEKPLAELAGIGWQGKHTNLVSRDYGSWLFLGAIFTTLELAPNEPEEDHCGQCQRCLDICPTNAFPKPYELDATRCIAYLTIEHKGHIPVEFREQIGNRVFGCDDCLAVCPWNKFAQQSSVTSLAIRPALASAPLEDLAALDDASFRTLFAGTPVKRTGRDRFIRNVLIAIGNSSDPSLAGAAENLLRDSSPLVRSAAIWALSRLLAPGDFARLRQKTSRTERDPEVLREWSQAHE